MGVNEKVNIFLNKLKKDEDDIGDEDFFELLVTYFEDGSNYHSVYRKLTDLVKNKKVKSYSVTLLLSEISKKESYYTNKPRQVKLK